MHRLKSAVGRSSRAGITRYLQLYHHLSRELTEGCFAPDEPLQSEPELVRLHRVSRTTVRRALDRLEREGRIERRRGSGTYALEGASLDPEGITLTHLSELHGRISGAKTLESGMAPVPRHLQSRHPVLGSQARLLRRLRLRQGAAFQLESIYFCRANGHALKVTRVVHEVTALAADAEAAQHLGVQPGTPVLRLKTEYLDGEGELIAVGDSLMRCDRAMVTANLRRKSAEGRWSARSA